MALQAFLHLAPDAAMFERMLIALDRQCRSAAWKEQRGRYIPYPANWLAKRYWKAEGPARRAADVAAEDWADECEREHGGRCKSQYVHGLFRGYTFSTDAD